jgi:hypothetical protein
MGATSVLSVILPRFEWSSLPIDLKPFFNIVSYAELRGAWPQTNKPPKETKPLKIGGGIL